MKLEEVDNSSPYTIMFGPDKCGFDTNKARLECDFCKCTEP
jgi:hypothetical protein